MTHSQQAQPKPAAKPDYSVITAPYREDLDRVEKAIRENFRSDVALIPDISSYLMSGGGKRIRPLLVIATSRLCGYEGDSLHIDYSVVAEYIHAATLLHDDVVDDAKIRRGADSAAIKFGNQASVLVGDFLFAKSLELLSAGGNMRIVEAVAAATKRLAEGEVLQLMNTSDINTAEEVYMSVIFRKTAALMMSCCQIGAALGGAPEKKAEALSEYGKNVGIAFQLIDDALDYTAEMEKWGKPIGADLAEGKPTLPLIRAYAAADERERKLLETALGADEGAENHLGPVLGILNKYGAISATVDLARTHAERARANLSGFGPSPHLDALAQIADYIVERSV